MITEKRIREAGEFIKQNCESDDFVLSINVDNKIDTRFAQNSITQNLAGQKVSVNLKVAFGDRTGSASINSISEDGLIFVLENAQNIADSNLSDPEYIESEKDLKLPERDNFVQKTADLNEENMVDLIKKCVNFAKEKNAIMSGMTTKSVMKTYILTGNGFESYDNLTEFSHSMTIKKGNIETKVSKSLKDISKFSIADELAKLGKQFDSLKNPEPSEKGKIAVILRPAAVEGLIQYLFWTMSQRESDEGLYPFTNSIGEKFFGEKFSLASKNDDDLICMKNSGQIVNSNINWVKNGVVENLRIDRFYAKKIDKRPIMPYNMLIEGGKTTEKEMMKMVDKGIIINRLWYIRPTDMKKGEFTGLTRDGVLYFENGEIKKSLNNLRWNEVIHDLTKRILALGKAELTSSTAKIPTMLVDNFNFVDTTSF